MWCVNMRMVECESGWVPGEPRTETRLSKKRKKKSKWGTKTRCATAGRMSYGNGEGRFVYLTPLSHSSNPPPPSPPPIAPLSRTAAHVAYTPCAPNFSVYAQWQLHLHQRSVPWTLSGFGSLKVGTKLNERSQLFDGKREVPWRLLTSQRYCSVCLLYFSDVFERVTLECKNICSERKAAVFLTHSQMYLPLSLINRLHDKELIKRVRRNSTHTSICHVISILKYYKPIFFLNTLFSL